MGIDKVVNIEPQSERKSFNYGVELYANMYIGATIGTFSTQLLGKALEARPGEFFELGLLSMLAGGYVGARYLHKLYS